MRIPILFFAATLLAGPAYGGTRVARVSQKQCQAYFDEVLRDTDEDLALVPYVQRALAEIYAVLNAPNLTDAKLVENLVEADVRAASFKIEGIGEALRAVDKNYFDQIYREGVALENLVGDYVFETELRDFVHGPEFASFLTPRIEAMFEGRVLGARENLVRNMHRLGWTGGTGDAYRRVLKWVEKSEPITKKSYLKKKLLKWIAGELEETHAMIVSKELDPNDIEGGIHKLRRLVRRIPVLYSSFGGMFYLDEGLKISGIKLAEEASVKAKYLPDETRLLKRAVAISKDGALYIGQLVSRLGKLKGNDGMKEFVLRALESAKFGAEAKPLKAALDPKGAAARSFRQTRAAAAEIFKEIVDSEAFLQMAEQFREAAREF